MKEQRSMGEEKILVARSSMPDYEEYIEAIKPLWDSHWLTNMGTYHMELENKLKEYLGVSQISLMVNGHMALEMAIQAMGFPEGAEVITTPFTFISTTHAIVRNHLKPVFCDIKLCDGTIDEIKIEELITEKTVAIIPVHVYGNVCNVEEIQKIADKHNLKVIYDAAHAFGVTYEGKEIGNYGDASVFSFHATKVFNTIEGGAVTFSDPELYDKLYDLKNFGIRDEEMVVSVGANAKMNEFAAIMGLCNLKHVDDAIERRKKHYEQYKSTLSDLEGIRFLEGINECQKNYAYFPIVVEENFGVSRDYIYNRLREKNIYARKYFYPLTADQKCFGEQYRNVQLHNARELAQKILVLPFYEELEEEKIERIVEEIRSVR